MILFKMDSNEKVAVTPQLFCSFPYATMTKTSANVHLLTARAAIIFNENNLGNKRKKGTQPPKFNKARPRAVSVSYINIYPWMNSHVVGVARREKQFRQSNFFLIYLFFLLSALPISRQSALPLCFKYGKSVFMHTAAQHQRADYRAISSSTTSMFFKPCIVDV